MDNKEKKYDFWITSAKDRFGDLGIIGLVLIKILNSQAFIDSFILSCRAMGRSIETAIMNHIKNYYFNSMDLNFLNAEYIPTQKNIPTKKFYEDQGFKILMQQKNGAKEYQLEKKNYNILECMWTTFQGV